MPDEPSERQPPPPETMSREAFDARLRALNAQRETERAREERRGPDASSDWGQAVRLSSEFIAAVIVGAALGYGFDRLFGTLPWGLIVFLMLGFAAAVLNVLRAVGEVPESKLNMRAVERTSDERDGGGDGTDRPPPSG